MKRYWDSSAVVDALHDSRVEQLIREPEQFTRTHTLSEVFSTLTGGRLGFQYIADDAAELIKEISAGLTFVDLTAAEAQAALDEAQRRGVRGGNVHDWMHAKSAKKAGVEVLLTDNLSDFSSLADGFTISPP